MKAIILIFIFFFIGCDLRQPGPVITQDSTQDDRPQKPECAPDKLYTDYVYAKRALDKYNQALRYTTKYSERLRLYKKIAESSKRVDFLSVNLTSYCSQDEIDQIQLFS